MCMGSCLCLQRGNHMWFARPSTDVLFKKTFSTSSRQKNYSFLSIQSTQYLACVPSYVYICLHQIFSLQDWVSGYVVFSLKPSRKHAKRITTELTHSPLTSVVHSPPGRTWDVSELGLQGQNYSHNNSSTCLLFHCFETCISARKKMDKTADALV